MFADMHSVRMRKLARSNCAPECLCRGCHRPRPHAHRRPWLRDWRSRLQCKERPMPSRSNRLLASLSKSDLTCWCRISNPWLFGLRKTLERPNRRIDAVYFPESGFASVVAIQPGGKQVQVSTRRQASTGRIDWPRGNDRAPDCARQPSLAPLHLRAGGRERPVYSSCGIAQGNPDQRAPARLAVEVSSGVRRATTAHRNLQCAVTN
jgi:hypothetical protein